MTIAVFTLFPASSMVRMGKVYENMMVDLMATSQKLVERSRRTVMMVTGLDYDVKTAVLVLARGFSQAEAESRLAAAGGRLRPAMEGA